MAKTEEDLRKSRENRERIIAEFGCVPESILLHDKADRAIDIHANKRCYNRDSAKGVGDGARVWRMSGDGTRGANGSLSRFPQNIGRLLLRLYTKTGDTVVDPFAGHNSRMELCWRLGRDYIGQDLSQEFMVANRTIRDMLLKEVADDLLPETHSQATITLHEGDSKKLAAADACGDFTITSPPYWDLEFYGEESEQLGYGKTYEQFCEGLQQVANENFRVLKAGAFCVWCVNDFRKGGKFYNYHGDTIDMLTRAGFTQHDIAITDLGSSFGAAFAQQVVERKILPKRHEFCLIFKKLETGGKTNVIPTQIVEPVKEVRAEHVDVPKQIEPTPKSGYDPKWDNYWKNRGLSAKIESGKVLQ